MNILPGIAYLTVGTVEQVQWLFKDQDVDIEYYQHPTLKELRRLARSSVTELFSDRTRVLIILPKELKAAPAVKSLTKKGGGGDKTKESSYLLPTDEYFTVPDNCYWFVICVDLTGALPASAKKSIKSLCGGVWQELNLTSLECGLYPLSQVRTINDSSAQLTTHQHERELVHSLTSLEGVQRWGNFNDKEFFKYFLIPGYRFMPLLSKAEALCLTVWLEPFICKIETSKSLTNPKALLREFAYWVYCSTHYWSEPYSEGLTTYTTYAKGIKQIKFSFYISTKAKIKWLKLLETLGV